MPTAEVNGTAALLDGRYRLGPLVGEGAMARVYRAEDVTLGRTVAIKLIRPGVDGATSDRARSEMTVLASLNHPSLVTLFDARLVPGRPEFLVMEFVDGPTLGERLKAGRLPPSVVAHLGAELAEALHVVHRAGVVHRDIKPSNVLLSPAQLPGARPRAKLADFGIAYLLDSARLTSPGLVIGTMAYLAPEQIRGSEPAAASDVYSLGLVLLEALTGQRAHPHGAGVDAVLARAERPPAIPDSLDPRWIMLLERMLDTNPAGRPSAAQVAAETRALLDSGATSPDVGTAAAMVPLTAPTLVAPVSGAVTSAPPVRAPARRRRMLLAALVGGILLAVAIGIGAGFAISAMSGPAQVPAPATTEPIQDEPVQNDPVPPGDDEGDGVDVDDPGMTEDERKAAEEAAKKAEKEQEKLEEEQRKQAEKEQEERERDQRDD